MGALALDPDQLSGAFTAAGMGVGVQIQTQLGHSWWFGHTIARWTPADCI